MLISISSSSFFSSFFVFCFSCLSTSSTVFNLSFELSDEVIVSFNVGLISSSFGSSFLGSSNIIGFCSLSLFSLSNSFVTSPRVLLQSTFSFSVAKSSAFKRP